MARRITKTTKKTSNRSTSSVKVTRLEEKPIEPQNGIFEKIQYDLQHNQSYLNLILGGLIVVVLGVLIYNYFNKPNNEIISPELATSELSDDVDKNDLPGKYTIKEGDTLFSIAQDYYDDGYKYNEIVKVNNLANENELEVGQQIIIPKIETTNPTTSSRPSMSPSAQSTGQLSPMPEATEVSEMNQTDPSQKGATIGTGGAENQTIWGEKITGNTYTVQEGDWLSKVAGRAYGDIMAYQKIAQANNISNPDTIEVGTVLQLPR